MGRAKSNFISLVQTRSLEKIDLEIYSQAKSMLNGYSDSLGDLISEQGAETFASDYHHLISVQNEMEANSLQQFKNDYKFDDETMEMLCLMVASKREVPFEYAAYNMLLLEECIKLAHEDDLSQLNKAYEGNLVTLDSRNAIRGLADFYGDTIEDEKPLGSDYEALDMYSLLRLNGINRHPAADDEIMASSVATYYMYLLSIKEDKSNLAKDSVLLAAKILNQAYKVSMKATIHKVLD